MCVCVCVCVFIHLFKIYLQQQFVGWRATSTGHLPTITRPVLCLMRYGQTVADKSPPLPLTVTLSLSDSLSKTLANVYSDCYDVTHQGHRKCDFSESFHGYSNSPFFSKLYEINFNDIA